MKLRLKTISENEQRELSRNWVLITFVAFLFIFLTGFFFTIGFSTGTLKSESYAVVTHNGEGEELYTFEATSTLKEDGKTVSEETTFTNPNQNMLEDTLEVTIEKDGKRQNVRFNSLQLVPDDVDSLVVTFNPEDDLDSVNGIVYVPSEDVIYE